MGAHIFGFLHLSKPSLSDPGAWNNMDLLTMCNGNMSLFEYKAQFSLWSIHQSPMILSVDLRDFNKTSFGPEGCDQLLVNEEVIAVNQDRNLNQGQLQYIGDYFEIYVKPLQDNGAAAMVIINKSIFEVSNFVNFKTILGIPKDVPCSVRDLWGRKNMGLFKGGMQINIKPTDVVVYKVAPAF